MLCTVVPEQKSPAQTMSAGRRQHMLALRHARAQAFNSENMYDDTLMEMSKQATDNLYQLTGNQLQSNFMDNNNTIQYQVGSQSNTSRTPRISSARPASRCSWTNLSVMFANTVSTPRHADGTSFKMSSSVARNFCYLCSAMEEHQRSHLKLRTSLNRDGSVYQKRQRIQYRAPVPPQMKKKEEEPVAVREALYKVTVWTGDVPGGSTDANVYITVVGDQGTLLKTKLWCRRGTSRFAFVRGSKEIFHIKGPKLGNLRMITIEHDGMEKRHGWYLDRIEVQCMLTGRIWVFSCKNWLSMHHSDFTIRRELDASVREHIVREFEVTVETGKKRLAGTDANVCLTLHGTEGSTHKLHLNTPNQGGCFKRGQTSKFRIRFPDVGEIRSLRIEHDGGKMATGWYLGKIMLQDLHQTSCVYYFLCNSWLAKDIGDGRLWCDLRALKHMPAEVTPDKPVLYEVMVKTGAERNAGTNANIHIIFSGTSGKTTKIFLNDTSNTFERNKVECFKLKALNVGKIKNIIIGHDNSGSGTGWFCEHIKIRKHLTRREISEHLSQQKQTWNTAKHHPKPPEDEPIHHDKEDISDKENEDKNTDTNTLMKEDKNEISTNSSKQGRSGQNGKDHEAVFDQRGKVLKIPVYEEYFFPCSQWFASDKDDGLLERELKAERLSLFYQQR